VRVTNSAFSETWRKLQEFTSRSRLFCYKRSTSKEMNRIGRVARASLWEATGLFESACKPGSVACSHSSGIRVTADLKQPTRVRCGPHLWTPIWPCSEWGLPSPWTVASHAVRSYRTFSTLPAARGPLRRFPFCCTFRRLAPPRRYLALRPVEPGLSSLPVR